jgi:predicted CopG family antitoxin
MPTIEVDDATLERLDQIRLGDESYDEVITELINIYEAEGLTLHRSGD